MGEGGYLRGFKSCKSNKDALLKSKVRLSKSCTALISSASDWNMPHAGRTPPPRLSAHVKKVLSETAIPLTPAQIRDSCDDVGIRASSPKMLLTAVHNAIRRLNGQVRRVKGPGRDRYIMRRNFRNRAGRSH